MSSVLNYVNYIEFIRNWINSQPLKGRGEVNKIANFLKVNPSLISQILSGSKDLTFEQAYKMTKYFGFDLRERDYFISLIQYARAGEFEYKEYLSKKIELLKIDALDLKSRVKSDHELSESEKTVYYSSYLYSAVRLFCSIGNGKSISQICDYFKIEREKASNIVNFLLSCFLVEKNNDLFLMTKKLIIIGRESPQNLTHHLNWRINSLKKIENIKQDDLVITFPISLDKESFVKIREELVETLKKIQIHVEKSNADELAFLNIDFFKFTSE